MHPSKIISKVAGLLIATAFTSTLFAAAVCDANNGGITLSQGFCAQVVADGLGTARHLAVAPNGHSKLTVVGPTFVPFSQAVYSIS